MKYYQLCEGVEWGHVNNPSKLGLHPPKVVKVNLLIYWLEMDICGIKYNINDLKYVRFDLLPFLQGK